MGKKTTVFKKMRTLALFLPTLLFSCQNPDDFDSKSTSGVTDDSLSSSLSLPSSTPSYDSDYESSESNPSSESSISSESSSSSSSASTEKYVTDGYWKGISLTSYGIEFRNELQAFIKAKKLKTIGYKSNTAILAKADADPDNSNNIISFYSGKSVSSWNKEHVWPNSRGTGDSGAGSDPHMLRACDSSINSSRGNTVYGTVSNTYDPASEGVQQYRGDASRIIFYTCMRYWDSPTKNTAHLHLTDTVPANKNIEGAQTNNEMGRISDLLNWNVTYKISDAEIRRNDVLEDLGFGRNPFIDYPEWVNRIWDITVKTSDIDTCYYRTSPLIA